MSRRTLTNIVARLSDRAATEMKLCQLIEEARKEILPTIKAGFDEMSKEDQDAASSILVLSCGLHGLIHFADCANTSLLEAEKGMFGAVAPCTEPAMVKPLESATVQLIHACCKAFARGADERNGCHLEFSSYILPFIRSANLHSLPLTLFRGNQFNIVFANASFIFFLRNEFIKFLNGKGNNKLLRPVLPI